jgi:hypothetical protein
MVNRQSISRLRQRILAVEQQRSDSIQRILGAGPMVRGTLITISRKCGKPGCRCTRGEGHVSKYLTASEDGRVVRRYVPAKDEVELARTTAEYQALRRARAQLAKLSADVLELIDRLQAELTSPYPSPAPPGEAPSSVRSPPRRGQHGKKTTSTPP